MMRLGESRRSHQRRQSHRIRMGDMWKRRRQLVYARGIEPAFATLVAIQKIESFLRAVYFARDGLPANIAAAESLRPIYFIDRGISSLLRLAHRLAACANIEHATAVRQDVLGIPNFGYGASMKYFHALDL